ncbi:MAG: NifB/NifX family molybdenum-iron cluster-binding protein, partial [Arcobacteraceae bacterium]|nr:NifB/NifX family molybdenum-iron cluster-binding protein [Arcobacteraceae bacterium]
QYSAAKIKEIKEKDTDVTVASLAGVDIVYFVDIGPAAAAKLINNGIFPIKYKEIIKIEDELNKLTKMLGTNPPPFIKKIIEKKVA